VALFERHCAEHDLGVAFDTLTALYQDPNDLSVLPDDKLKLMARRWGDAAGTRSAGVQQHCSAGDDSTD
jgi:hypothetical protein